MLLRLICGYAPQGGRSLERKLSFYDELKDEFDMNSVDDLVVCLGDFNGHMGRHIDGFDGVHGGYDVSNLEGRLLLVLHREKLMCVKYIA